MEEMIVKIIEKAITVGIVKVLQLKCHLSPEAIRRVFKQLIESKTEAEQKAVAARNQDAAWAMYVQMITRITTQPLPDEHGDEQTALNSVYSLFATTRDILTEHGRTAPEFSGLAVLILNQKVRPFTAKWHVPSTEGAFEDDEKCAEFRRDLADLQVILSGFMQALADLAGVQDITDISEV